MGFPQNTLWLWMRVWCMRGAFSAIEKNIIIITRNISLTRESLRGGFHRAFVLPCYTASVSHQTATVYPRTVCGPHEAHDRPNKLASCQVYRAELYCSAVCVGDCMVARVVCYRGREHPRRPELRRRQEGYVWIRHYLRHRPNL